MLFILDMIYILLGVLLPLEFFHYTLPFFIFFQLFCLFMFFMIYYF